MVVDRELQERDTHRHPIRVLTGEAVGAAD